MNGSENVQFHHMSFCTGAYDECVKFYITLGMKIYFSWSEEGIRHCFLDMGNGPFLEIHEKKNCLQSADYHLCLHVEDVDAFYKKAIDAGAVDLDQGPFQGLLETTEGKKISCRLANLRAPGGEILELLCWKNYRSETYQEYI